MSVARKRMETDVIPLLRGGAVVSSLAGAFGSSIRETRLTAMLGYAVSLSTDRFNSLFGFEGATESVTLEAFHERDRSDIRIETSKGVGVVEAKIDAVDPTIQAHKYNADWRALLTNHVPTKNQKRQRGVRYIDWECLAKTLRELSQQSAGALKFICADLIRYLEEHNMIRKRESVEIYAREINNEKTLNLFLKARMYGCDYERSSRLPEALYFAPHFGKSISHAHPGVSQGISYIARVETIRVIDSWPALLLAAKEVRGKQWLKNHKKFLEAIRDGWSWPRAHKRSMLFLGEPRLVFNPPVKKDNLQKGKGWLSKRTFPFDELFAAWGK